MIFLLISVIVFVGYALLITAITMGWLRLKVFRRTDSLPKVKVSIIVAARNEARNVERLLNSLLAQDYPSHLVEIIIIDDHSTDITASLVEEFIPQKRESHNLKLIRLAEEDGSGKKTAIDCGIQASEGELIVITDADCTSGSQWISTLSSFYTQHQPGMMLGPVCIKDEGNFFGKLQSLEFVSLISAAAGSCSAGFPILANGANIAFTRQAYDSCGGFSGNLQYPSGDDMFLMMSIKKKFGVKAIRFLFSKEAIVYTPATLGFRSFIQQRLRWVSKSRGYTDPMLILTSILVFLTNVLLVFTAFASILNPGYFKFFLGFYLLKIIIDFPLMLSYSRFQKSTNLLWLFPVMELLNAVYTLMIGIAGNAGKYEWKGRRVSNKGMERG
ncbi:MAG: glycosyltransferase [Bacteroidales bacterium]|nr:glycosyltransferase [Bacteroidales bacterium]